MQIKLISHASVLIESGGQRLLTDPWTVGKVFNESWALLSPPAPVDYGQVDYIWISHEHPDHFNIPTLRSIPETDRKRIRVLYQKHASPRLLVAVGKLGFSSVVELPQYRWLELKDGLKVFCGSVASKDSFLAVSDGTHCVLNMNDCILTDVLARDIKRHVGSVDVLLTQFSFATWVGNDADDTEAASRKIKQLTEQYEIFKPRYTFPFASFITFCSNENARMNDWVNSPQFVRSLDISGLYFLYPGDTCDLLVDQAPVCATQRYRDDFNDRTIDPTPPPVTLDALEEAMSKRMSVLRKRVPRPLRRFVPCFDAYLHDTDQVLSFDVASGQYQVTEASPSEAAAARFVMCSQAAEYSFKFSWGLDTLLISGMYRDRGFAVHGKHPLFRIQNLVNTEIFDVSSVSEFARVLEFHWRKRREYAARLKLTR